MALPMLLYPAYLPASKPAFPCLLTMLFHASAYLLARPCLPLPSWLVVCRCLHGSMPVSLHVPCCLYLRNFTQVPSLPASVSGCFYLPLLGCQPAFLLA
jgi:hypothetical protein